MAAILTDSVLVFALRSSAGSLSGPAGFIDDPSHLIASFTRLQTGIYQMNFTRAVDVAELELALNPAGFDANPPNYEAPPVAWPLWIGDGVSITGLVVAIGLVGTGLADHDFEVIMKQIRIAN